MAISLLIVSDIALYREGLRLALVHRVEFGPISTAHHVRGALERIATTLPDAILFDLAMPNALTALRSLAQHNRNNLIIALTVPDVDEVIVSCAEAGATAFVTRDASLEDLVTTIATARRGHLNCSAKVAGALFRQLSVIASEWQWASGDKGLTPRETQILQLIERGLSNKDISRALSITVATVKNHVHHILEKMHVTRRGEAAAALRQMQ